MAAFEYLSVLITIILALGMTRVLRPSILRTRCSKASRTSLRWGPIYYASNLLYFAGLTTAAITRNERYHELYAIFFWLKRL
jgi:hypothetical protein